MNDEILHATLKRRLGELELEIIHLQAALERERLEKAEMAAMLNDAVGNITASNREMS